MVNNIAYRLKISDQFGRAFNWKNAIITLLFTFTAYKSSYSQSENTYDEISVLLTVQRIGSLDVPVIISNEQVYLPVKEVFDFLKIKNTIGEDFSFVNGYFINPEATYVIDKTKNQIIYQNIIYQLNSDELINTESNLYLKSNYFGQVFGLDCIFNIRSLSVNLNTKLELPAVREMQQELMRRNIGMLQGEAKADTTIKRKFGLFHLGTIDWSVINTQENKNVRVNLGIGAIIAGGEANVFLDYNNKQKIKPNQQYYRWRYVNNNNNLLRQTILGRVYTPSTSSIFFPVNGIQLTNTPTIYRRSFGTYRLSSKTEPGWIVELYVNNVLINYMKADASGFFAFDVPIVYGNSAVKLRFYGPWGEERIEEQNIVIPFNFLPAREFEYNLTAGIVSDSKNSRFARANFNYGLNNRITIGGGMEYLSSVTSGKTMPFVNASVRLGTQMMISGEHTYGVRTKGTINFKLPYDLQLDANYTKYKKGQTAINNSFNDERKVVLSIPVRGKKISAFSRLSLYQATLPKFKFTTAEFLLSSIIYGVSTNFTTNAIYTNSTTPVMSSNLSFTFRLPKGFRFTPQAQYQYSQKNFSMLRCELEKNISSKGFLNIGYEKNTVTKINYATVAVRYNFSFMQTAFSARHSNISSLISTVQGARGSILYNENSKKFIFHNQNNVGKGGLIILPYLDINCNGKRDKNEPKVFGLRFTVNGGRIENNLKDTTVQITGLEAYANYFIKIDKNSFGNVAWKINHQTLSVVVEPNYLKVVEIPVSVVGEVSGMVYLLDEKENVKKPQGRVMLDFYDSSNKLVGRAISEADGYFSFLGLAPGLYTARVDNTQLGNLKMVAKPENISFNIKANQEGDVVDKLEFILLPVNSQQ